MINRCLKAISAFVTAGISVLIGATQASDATWSDLTLNTWLVALGAGIAAFNAIYWIPNTGAPVTTTKPPS